MSENEFVNDLKNLVGPEWAPAIDWAAKASGYGAIAIEAYNGGKQFLTYVGLLHEPASPLNEVLAKLNSIQQKLDMVLKKEEDQQIQAKNLGDHIDRLIIYNDAIDVQTAANSAFNYLTYGGPGNLQTFEQQRSDAEQKVNHFRGNPTYWESVYLGDAGPIRGDPYPGVYADHWSGPLYPPLTRPGFYWDYRTSLLGYLASLNYWWVCILASDPAFVAARTHDMAMHNAKLTEILEQIMASYVAIRPPSSDELKWLVFTADPYRFYWYGINGVHYPLSAEEKKAALDKAIPGGRWQVANFVYGMVEINTGWHVSEAYPAAEIQDAAPYLRFDGFFTGVGDVAWIAGQLDVTDPAGYQAAYERFAFRHTVRTWRLARQLSRELNLRGLRSIIETQCRDVGEPAPALPAGWYRYVGASLRSLHSILPLAVQSPQGEPIRMSAIAGYLGNSGPASLRQMLLVDP
jgi:hypothetical protein